MATMKTLLAGSLLAFALHAQDDPWAASLRRADVVPAGTSRLAPFLERFDTDRDLLLRSTVPLTAARRERLRSFHEDWRAILDAMPFDEATAEERVDWHLLSGHLRWRVAEAAHEEARDAAAGALIGWRDAAVALVEARRRVDHLDPKAAADAVQEIARAAVREKAAWAAKERPSGGGPAAAHRASNQAGEVLRMLEEWYRFYAGFDPLFTWWVEAPWKEARDAIESHEKFLREELAGQKDQDALAGEPIGAEAIRDSLEREMIAYGPDELIAIAESEWRWCEAEMKKASRDLGCGDDWKAALAKVRGLHLDPGRQPALVRELAEEAVRFLEDKDLVTVPPLCRESWRMEMMSPDRQKVNPFFLGGEVITVAFPKASMPHEDKLTSLRANNVHFARATVHHELIPGHGLQYFMLPRHRPWRRPFSTPFWMEGWALSFELLLWDQGFARGPEDRVGMLFWRMHRCARIVFSLRYHLGTMSAAEAVDYLVERVGHERWTAEGEVRRSIQGGYDPLYQVAYLIGGLQFEALRRELVAAGKTTFRALHDGILRQGPMPVELVRAAVTGAALPKGFKPSWRFHQPR